MKELYIRKGNSETTQNVLIIGEEQYLGSRDKNGYIPNKGSDFSPIKRVDPYSHNINLTYIHATPNVKLNTPFYKSDHDVHKFVKSYCRDIVKWDGETNEGYVRSREAFIVNNGYTAKTAADELYKRIETEVHGGVPTTSIIIKRFLKILFFLIAIPFKILFWLLGIKRKKYRRHTFRLF